MNGLREFGRRSIDNLERMGLFRPSFSPLRIVDVRLNTATNSPSLSEATVQESDLNTQLQQQDDPGSTLPFRMVCIPLHVVGNEDTAIGTSRATFESVISQFSLSPVAAHHIYNNSYGFFIFEQQDSPPTFYVGAVDVILIWVSKSQDSTTRALLLSGSTTDPVIETFRIYESRTASKHFAHSAMALYLSEFIDKNILSGLKSIRGMEVKTGHGLWAEERGAKPRDIEDLTRWSGEISSTIANLANMIRHADITKALVSFMQEDMRRDTTQPTGLGESDLGAFLSTLERQLVSQKASIRYLQERAKTLSTVLLALLARQDALASISIAERAGRDSSSMKTIAVMTMGFLPATFFAALFALPSLDWTQNPVIQDRFWVYWAFTLPSTLAIFGMWYLVNYRSLLKSLYKKEA